MYRKCYSVRRRAVSPVVATIILVAIFTVLVGAALGVSRDLISGGYTQSDASEARSLCSALGAAVSTVAFTYSEAQSVGYTFRSTSTEFIPNALEYVIQLSGGPTIQVSTGLILAATPATQFSYGANYYSVVYPPNGGRPTAPTVGTASGDVWAIQEDNSSGHAEYVFTAVFAVPQLVDTGMVVGGQAVWRLYVVRLMGGPGVQVFSDSGYITVDGVGEQVYSYGNVTAISVATSSSGSPYPPGFLGLAGSSYTFADPGSVILQVVVANVTVSGTMVQGAGNG